jgi:prefoldin subunit 5
MIVQLTDNLYLKGTIKNKDEFLYDLGTGYYSKLSSEQIKNQFQYTKNFCSQNETNLHEEIA